MSKKTVIITPVHNRKELTLQCLKSLARIDKTNLDIHIIVIDDGSTDGTAEAITADFPEIEIRTGDGNLWYTGGINKGLKAALEHDPEYILAINNDTVFDEKFLQYLIETAEKYPRSVIGAILLLWNEPHKLFQTSPRWELLSGGWRHWRQQTVWSIPRKPWEVEIIVGNCILFPAEAVREAGLMKEKHLPQYGDAEYTPRLRRLGWKLLIEPRARVFCKPNDPPPKIKKMSFGTLIRSMFIDPYNGFSLRRRLHTCLYGAPNKFEGLLAFHIFFLRLLLGKNLEGRYAEQIREKPLTEIFKEKIIP